MNFSNRILTAVFCISLFGASGVAHADANIVVTPTLLNFGTMIPNQGARDIMFSLENRGDQPTEACSAPVLSGPNTTDFIVRYSTCTGVPLFPGKFCGAVVRGAPLSPGLKTAQVTIQCGALAIPAVSLQAIGAETVSHGAQEFQFTGSDQQFVVPSGITQLTVKMWGAGAESGSADMGNLDCETQPGGGGGFAMGTLSVSAGQIVTVRVGGRPTDFTSGGWPNGGKGYLDKVVMGRRTYIFGAFGGAGGSSSVLVNGVVAMEAGGGNGGLPCENATAGGQIRSCVNPGNQKGTDYTQAGVAGGGGFCGGASGIGGSSFIPANGTEEAGSAELPGAPNDPDRKIAGQGANPFAGAPATNGSVKIVW